MTGRKDVMCEAVATVVGGSKTAVDLCHACCQTSGGMEAHCDGPSSTPMRNGAVKQI